MLLSSVPPDIYFLATGQRSGVNKKYLYISISCGTIQNNYSIELPITPASRAERHR
jgi:hypothetical protein